MKLRYLNQQNKTHLLILALMASETKNISESLKLDGAQKQKASTISTHANTLFGEIMESLDDHQRAQMLRLIRDKTIEVVPSNVFTRKEQESEEDEWVSILAQKAFEANCIKCERKDHNSCERKCALINMSVPLIHEETEDCPYRVLYDAEGKFIRD